MKQKFFLLIFLSPIFLTAQKVNGLKVEYKPCSGFQISKAVIDLPTVAEDQQVDSEKQIIN